ncbi:MAG: FG-GAP repeat protein [Rhodobacteraceae bacterium]|nr:FG-GAP repeat protein [Paracoccaceae bacterium]
MHLRTLAKGTSILAGGGETTLRRATRPAFSGIAGETYVVFGAAAGFDARLDLSTLDGANGFRIEGFNFYDSRDRAVAGVGDINGDGVDDLIIGASRADPGERPYAGESYVVFGSGAGFEASLDLDTLDGSNGFHFGGIDEGDLSGASVAGAGDVHGEASTICSSGRRAPTEAPARATWCSGPEPVPRRRLSAGRALTF